MKPSADVESLPPHDWFLVLTARFPVPQLATQFPFRDNGTAAGADRGFERRLVMNAGDSFGRLLGGLHARDEAAAAAVCDRFTTALVTLARNHLATWLRAKVDAEDVVQSALRSFFTRCQAGTLAPQDWDGLWRLLATITLRKCFNRHAHYRAACRDVIRELPGVPGRDWDFPDRDPTPEEALALADAVADLLAQFDPPEQEILVLSLQGYDTSEVASTLQRAERSVRRVRERARRLLERRRADFT